MDIPKLNRDLKILLARYGPDQVTWSTQAEEPFIILKALALPDNIRPRVTGVKIPIPANLYEPTKKGGFHYYRNAFVDPRLQVRYPDNSWGSIPRHHDEALQGKGDAGWRFLCLYPKKKVNDRVNVTYFIRTIQVWFKNCLELNP